MKGARKTPCHKETFKRCWKASSAKWINTIQRLGSVALHVVGSSNVDEFSVRSVDVGLAAKVLLELDTWSEFAKICSHEFTTFEWQRNTIDWQLFVGESVERQRQHGIPAPEGPRTMDTR